MGSNAHKSVSMTKGWMLILAKGFLGRALVNFAVYIIATCDAQIFA